MTVQQGVKGRIEPAIQSRARWFGNWRPLPPASGLAPLTTGFAVSHVARGRELPMGCAAAPAILSQSRRCGDWRPCWPRRELTPPHIRFCAIPVASCASCDGPRSGPGDLGPGTVVRRLAAVPAASGLAPPTTGFAVSHVARGRELPMGCAAAPAILNQSRRCGDWRPCRPRRELTPPHYRLCADPL